MRWIFFACLIFFNDAASGDFADVINTHQQGIVVKIIDGDTFHLLTKEKRTLRIRMNGIDCPERKQEFYKVSKDALAGYIFKKEVGLTITGYDRSRRTIAVVWYNKKNINLEMLKSGYAWHYKKYSADTIFAKAEKQARRDKKGLWQIKNPVAPWKFRKT